MALDRMAAPERKLWQLAREQTDGWATLQQDNLRLSRLLSRRDQDAESFFAGAAMEWDKLREELYGRRVAFDAMLGLLPDEWTVADLGCGTGTLAAELAMQVKQVIGVDQSPPMLKAARKRTENLPNVDLRKGSILALPIDDHSCDAAIFLLVLTYVPDPQAAIREAVRILKPGGRLLLVDLLRHDRDDFRRQMGQQVAGFEPAVATGMLESSGLTRTRLRELPPEPAARGPALFVASGTRSL
jgi:ArsR family transcriptional regulator